MALATPLSSRIIRVCRLNQLLGLLAAVDSSGKHAGVAQWLERHVANVNVVGSIPITRSVVFQRGWCGRQASSTLLDLSPTNATL